MIMKNIIKIFIVIFIIGQLTACYDRDIIDEKDIYNFSMPDVQDLHYTKNGNTLKLTWKMPEDISENFKRPIEVKVRVVEDNIYKDLITVLGEETSVEITIDPSKENHVIVKLFGYIIDDVKEVMRTDNMYSRGQILDIK